MTSTIETIGYAQGLASGFCGPCAHLVRMHARACCSSFDKMLEGNGGQVKRCAECLNKHANDEGND